MAIFHAADPVFHREELRLTRYSPGHRHEFLHGKFRQDFVHVLLVFGKWYKQIRFVYRAPE